MRTLASPAKLDCREVHWSFHDNLIPHKMTSCRPAELGAQDGGERTPFSSHDSIQWLDFPNWCINRCTFGALSRRIVCTYGAFMMRDWVIVDVEGGDVPHVDRCEVLIENRDALGVNLPTHGEYRLHPQVEEGQAGCSNPIEEAEVHH